MTLTLVGAPRSDLPAFQDVEKLDRFIHPSDSAGARAEGSGAGGVLQPGTGVAGVASANFEVVTAIRVLKSAGHADHAAELARRHKGEPHVGNTRVGVVKGRVWRRTCSCIARLDLGYAHPQSWIDNHGCWVGSAANSTVWIMTTSSCPRRLVPQESWMIFTGAPSWNEYMEECGDIFLSKLCVRPGGYVSCL